MMGFSSKRWTLFSLRTLDAFLPPRIRHWPAGDRFRARSTALIIALGVISIGLHVLQLHVDHAQGMHLASGYIFLTLVLVFLSALKLVARPQLVGSAYLVLLSIASLWLTTQFARSILAESFHWFPTLILGLYLVSPPRLASCMAGLLIMAAVVMISYLKDFGLAHPYGVTFEQYTDRLASTLLLSNIATLVLVIAFLALTRTNRRAWKQEKTWQLQAARMREMSELAASAGLLMERPLERLQKQHADLLKGAQNSTDDDRILLDMSRDLQQLTRISESFSLLARPRQEEMGVRMSAEIWLQHLTHIVLRRVSEKSWDLQIRYEPDNLVIQGPLGRLSMLIVLCLQDTFLHAAPESGSPLRLGLKGYQDHVAISIGYERPYHMAADQNPVNDSLIEELLNSMAAIMRRTQEGDQMLILIQGPWHDAV